MRDKEKLSNHFGVSLIIRPYHGMAIFFCWFFDETEFSQHQFEPHCECWLCLHCRLYSGKFGNLLLALLLLLLLMFDCLNSGSTRY